MFLDNKYTRIYFQLVEHGKHSCEDNITEKHHIIPRSLGGSDTTDNTVEFTPRQHYVAHRLLTKMCEGEMKSKMTFALHTFFHFNHYRRLNFTSRQYEYHKRAFAEACKNRAPWYKTDLFKFKHMDTQEEFVGTRREFINYSKLSEQEANFLFKAAGDDSLPTRWIKGWGVWVDSLGDWSYNKVIKRPPAKRVMCEHCSASVSKANYTRWHGPNCKSIDYEGHYERTRQVAGINKR